MDNINYEELAKSSLLGSVGLAEKIKFNEDAKQSLLKGIDLATDAIASTFGPNGTNVLIRSMADVHITKDGATVANSLRHADPFVSTGIELIKKISRQTAEVVGDGSTTSAILARALIHKYKDEKNPIELSRKLFNDCEKVIAYLNDKKVMSSSYDDIKKIATLSANNDPVIGTIVADAFKKVGKDGLVQFKASESVKDEIEYSNGFRIESGYVDKSFADPVTKTCELTNVLVHISDVGFSEVKDVEKIMQDALRQKKSLLIVAPEYEAECKLFLSCNQKVLKSCAIACPNYRYYRSVMLKDMRTILGESMTCDKVVISENETVFMGCQPDKAEVKEKIKEIKKILKTTLVEFEEDFHSKRLANFTSGIATIYVGGISRVEQKERMDRVEDSIKAAKAAFKGILPGGGKALACAYLDGVAGSLDDVILTPYRLLSGTTELPDNDFWKGINWKTGEHGDLMKLGVIEPFLVEKTALENAVKTASLILTTKCTILSF